jgi:hypothetical protein
VETDPGRLIEFDFDCRFKTDDPAIIDHLRKKKYFGNQIFEESPGEIEAIKAAMKERYKPQKPKLAPASGIFVCDRCAVSFSDKDKYDAHRRLDVCSAKED